MNHTTVGTKDNDIHNITRTQMTESLIERHGKEVQEKLSKARVAIAGLGGLGSHIAFMLTRSGIGCLHLIDFDRIDISNLNRQCYPASSIGERKTDRLKIELLRANPFINIETTDIKLDSSNIAEVFKDETLVCEAFDKGESKAMLINTLSEVYPDTDIVSGNGMAGYESSNLITSRRLTSHLWLCGDGINGIENRGTLMAARVSICAAHQANMIIRLILGIRDV